MQLRVAEQYLQEFGKLAKQNNTMILPANMSDIGSMIALAMNVIRGPHPPSPDADRDAAAAVPGGKATTAAL